MTASRIQGQTRTLARKTSLAFIALAIVNVAVIPLMLGCDSTHPLSSANASTSRVSHLDPAEPYLPRLHEISPDAAHGNVMTYEHN